MENPKLILIGDTEGTNYVDGKPVFEKIKEAIEEYKPVFVLSERMENNNIMSEWNFTQIMKKKKISNMTPMDDVLELIKLCHKKNIKIIGIDFENFLMDRKLQTKLNKYPESITKEEEKQLEELGKRRENKHVKMIFKYLELSRKPVVAIVGAKELRKGSQIRRDFRHLEGGCRIIFPVNEKGEQALGPTKERLKWGEEEL